MKRSDFAEFYLSIAYLAEYEYLIYLTKITYALYLTYN